MTEISVHDSQREVDCTYVMSAIRFGITGRSQHRIYDGYSRHVYPFHERHCEHRD